MQEGLLSVAGPERMLPIKLSNLLPFDYRAGKRRVKVYPLRSSRLINCSAAQRSIGGPFLPGHRRL